MKNQHTFLTRTVQRLTRLLPALVFFAALPALAQLTETHGFTNLNRPLPDGSANGLAEFRTVTSAIRSLTSVRVKLKVAGEFNGDLYGYLTHGSGFTVLLNRPGRTAAAAAGYDDSGLDVTFDAAAATDIHIYRTAVTPPAGSPLTGQWQPDSRAANPDTVTDATARTALMNSFANLDANGEWVLFLADLESGGTNQLVGWELELTGRGTPVITWPEPADITYGTALGAGQLNATASVAGTFSYSPAGGTVLNAGEDQPLTVVFTPGDLLSYSAVTQAVSLDVSKAALQISADDRTKVYAASLPAFTVTYAGFVNGDTPASLDTPVSLNTLATAASDVGSYPITASEATDPNYDITYTPGTLTITPANLQIIADNKSKTYGAPLPSFTATYSGFVNGDTPASLDTPPTLGTTATPGSDAGDYAITATGATDANYLIAFTSGMLTINKSASIGSLAASTNFATAGQPLTLTLSVSAVAPGAGTPTGSVQFRDGGNALGATVALVNGSATLILTTLPAGAHNLSADYAGDNNFEAASASLVAQVVINAPPVAGADSIERFATQGVKVPIATLLTNDTDADGDPVAFNAVSATSPAGGTLTTLGAWIHYLPPVGFTNADMFTYTITDGRGGSATGTVSVQIKDSASVTENVRIDPLGDGSYRVRFFGLPGSDYFVQFSDTLNPPAWTTLQTITTDARGYGELTNTPPLGVTTRYFRTAR